MEKTTIQNSLEKARESFMEWYSLKSSEFANEKDREDKAVDAILALSEVVSRSTMDSFGDLLSEKELLAVHQSLCLLRKEESDAVFKRSIHHAIQRLMDNFTDSFKIQDKD